MSKVPAWEIYLQVWHAHGALWHLELWLYLGLAVVASRHPSSPMFSVEATPR